eukprot:32413-Eustigmatos_ZCMA.PRE.1
MTLRSDLPPWAPLFSNTWPQESRLSPPCSPIKRLADMAMKIWSATCLATSGSLTCTACGRGRHRRRAARQDA